MFVHRTSTRAPAHASSHLAAPQAADRDRVVGGTTPPVRLHMHLSGHGMELGSISSTFYRLPPVLRLAYQHTLLHLFLCIAYLYLHLFCHCVLLICLCFFKCYYNLSTILNWFDYICFVSLFVLIYITYFTYSLSSTLLPSPYISVVFPIQRLQDAIPILQCSDVACRTRSQTTR